MMGQQFGKTQGLWPRPIHHVIRFSLGVLGVGQRETKTKVMMGLVIVRLSTSSVQIQGHYRAAPPLIAIGIVLIWINPHVV